jgi:hypothetical protein
MFGFVAAARATSIQTLRADEYLSPQFAVLALHKLLRLAFEVEMAMATNSSLIASPRFRLVRRVGTRQRGLGVFA